MSEWVSFIVRETDIAFAKGANLAAILTAVSGIETHLRSECGLQDQATLFELIDNSLIDQSLKVDLHKLRKYRNKWVHVNEPWNDEQLLELSEKTEQELEGMASFATRLLRRTIYDNHWI